MYIKHNIQTLSAKYYRQILFRLDVSIIEQRKIKTIKSCTQDEI